MPLPETLPAAEIHLHTVEDAAITSPRLLAAYEALLTPEERRRRDRFHFPRHRHRFLVSRALLRTTLSHYRPRVAPADWRFGVNAYGRPHITGDAAGGLDFNLSHTEGRMVLAVCRVPLPGVDIEALDRTVDMLELARQFFAPAEAAELLSLPASLRRRRFFDLWTLKEAYVKARGMGLSIPLAAFAIGFPDGGALSMDLGPDAGPVPWRLWSIEIGDAHALSLAVAHQGHLKVRMFENTPLLAIDEIRCEVRRQGRADRGGSCLPSSMRSRHR